MLSARTRVEILKLLHEDSSLTVDDLSLRIGVNVSTVSQHLQLLRMQGLVVFKQTAQTRYYTVNEAEIAQGIAAFLQDMDLLMTR